MLLQEEAHELGDQREQEQGGRRKWLFLEDKALSHTYSSHLLHLFILRLRLPVSGRGQRPHQDRRWRLTLPSAQHLVSSSSDWGHESKQKGLLEQERRVWHFIFLFLLPSPEDAG